ncbi:MAG: hypothetical protein NTX25_04955 [Proteobacteria bacterium]|nr:hypothetical protein [Pseudomonadota bacterium]
MKTYKPSKIASLSLLSFFMWGCGNSNGSRSQASLATQLSADTEQSEAAVSASLSEAMESLSDSNLIAASGSSLASDSAKLADTVSIEKTCTVKDAAAEVNIKRSRTKTWDKTTKRFTLKVSASDSNTIVRTWSKEGASISCKGKSAAIDFEADLTGLKTEITVDRSTERSSERVLLKSGTKISNSSKSTAKGTRSIEWLSQTAHDDGSISRAKNISFSIDRSLSLVTKEGEAKTLDLKLESPKSAPLNVTVTWDKLTKDRSLISKSIDSGTIKVSKKDAGYVEANFSEILLKFSSDECSFYSGSLMAKIFAEGQTEASKTYKLSAVEGEITIEDITQPDSPVAVDDFEYSPCDLSDFKI